MNEKELKFILQEGEGLKIEFKESFDKFLAKEMVAFANSEGGRIFLGVNDNGIVKGIAITNRVKSQIQDIARNCDPSIKIDLEEFNKVLIINVEEEKDKPYKCSSGFYLRQGANSQKLSRNEIIDFSISEGKIRFDEQINNEFEFPNDFDGEKLNNYLSLAKISKIISNEKIFAELNIIKKDKPLKFNNAGVLFFAKEPQRFISHSVFTCVSFKNKEGSDIIDRQEITGNLIEIIEEVMKFVVRNTRVAYKFTGKPQRENIYEYPLEAIREAVINSVTHRDYFEGGHNNLLKIFPDKISIVNVWIKPKRFEVGKDVFRRNKIIADLLSRTGLIEKVGSGFARMKNYCKEVNAPLFKLDINEKYFRIEFFKSKDYLDMTSEKVIKTRVKTRVKMIDIIRQNPSITIPEIAEEINLTIKGVEWNILKLKQKGLLKRIGSAKGGHWKIVKNDKNRGKGAE